MVGEYQTGRITGKPALNSGFPVLDDNKLIGVVYAAIDLNSLAAVRRSGPLAPGSRVDRLDRTGRVLARVPPEAQVVGASLVGTPVVDLILSQGTGTTEQKLDDQTYVIAFESLRSAEQGNAYLSIALPKADITAPAEKRFGDNLTRLGLAVMVILIAAWVGTDLLVRRARNHIEVLVRRYYDAFSTGGVDLLDEVVADDFLDHDPMPGQPSGLLGLKQAVGVVSRGLPGWRNGGR